MEKVNKRYEKLSEKYLQKRKSLGKVEDVVDNDFAKGKISFGIPINDGSWAFDK